MATNWGPTEHPMEHEHLEDGDGVCMGTPEHELNEYHYSETDARETGGPSVSEWKRVDDCSGPADWQTGKAMHHFEDGPAGWKQT